MTRTPLRDGHRVDPGGLCTASVPVRRTIPTCTIGGAMCLGHAHAAIPSFHS